MSVYNQFQYKPNFFQDKIVVYHPGSGLSEIAKFQTIVPGVNWFIKLFRYFIEPSSRIENVMRGFEAETIEAKSSQEIIQYLNYTQLFHESVIQKHNRSIWPCQTPLDTKALDHKREALVKKLFTEENDQTTAESVRNYFLTGTIELNAETLFKVAAWAHKYQIRSLTHYCDQKVLPIFGDESLDLPITENKLRWMIDVEVYGLEGTKQKILKKTFPVKEIAFLFHGHMDICTQFIQSYPQPNLEDYFRKQNDRMHREKFFEVHPWSELCRDLKQEPHNFDVPIKSDTDSDPYSKLIRDVLGSVEEEQTMLEKALNLGLKEAAEEIYNTITERACQLAYPWKFYSDDWNFLEVMRKQPKAQEALQARLHLLAAHAKDMAALFPDNAQYSLLQCLFQKSSPFSREEVFNIFVSVLAPYILQMGAFSPLCFYEELSSLGMLKVIKLVNRYANYSQNLELQKYVKRHMNGVNLVIKKATEELQHIEGDEALRNQIIDAIRTKTYPMIPFNPDVVDSYNSKNSFKRLTKYVKLFEEAIHIPIENTKFNDNKSSDITLKFPNGKELYLHKAILSRSPYFAGMLGLSGYQLKEASQKVLEINDLEDSEILIFIELLKYLYTNKLEIDGENGATSLRLAQKFQIEPKFPLICYWLEQLIKNSGLRLQAKAIDANLQAANESGFFTTALFVKQMRYPLSLQYWEFLNFVHLEGHPPSSEDLVQIDLSRRIDMNEIYRNIARCNRGYQYRAGSGCS